MTEIQEFIQKLICSLHGHGVEIAWPQQQPLEPLHSYFVRVQEAFERQLEALKQQKSRTKKDAYQLVEEALNGGVDEKTYRQALYAALHDLNSVNNDTDFDDALAYKRDHLKSKKYDVSEDIAYTRQAKEKYNDSQAVKDALDDELRYRREYDRKTDSSIDEDIIWMRSRSQAY